MGGSPGDVGEVPMMYVKQQNGCRTSCDVGKAAEGLENELWRRWSNVTVVEWAVTWVERQKSWRMSCDVGEATKGWRMRLCLILQPFVASSTSQLILQPFRRFTYVTARSTTLPLLHLRHRHFTYVTWRAAHAPMMMFNMFMMIL